MSLVRLLLSLIHAVLLLLLTGTLLNDFINPTFFWGFNFLSLIFPFVLILYVLFTALWLIQFRKRGWVFLFFLVLFLTPIRRWVNYSKTANNPADFKVISFNTKGVSPELSLFFERNRADILLLQENGYYEKDKLSLPAYAYTAKKYPLISIYSKFPILKEGEILDRTTNGHSQYADIKVNGKIIRFVNVYLEPFQLSKSMVKPSKDLSVNEEKAFALLHKFIPTFKLHEKQITEIKKFIDQSPYPVVIGGDFNAVPNSYEYYTLGKNLNDAFLDAGKGFSTSFHDYKIPIRIDYLFSSQNIRCSSYTIDRQVHISDHFPVIANFHWKK